MSKRYSLSDVTRHLNLVIDANFASPIWLTAELAQAGVSRGNRYLNLIQKDAVSGQIIAQLNAVLWLAQAKQLATQPNLPLDDILQDGREVLLHGRIAYNERYGVQFVIDEVDAAYTIGQFELQRLESLRRLEAEGLIGLNAQLPLVIYPRRLAVISSTQAAGWQDFYEHLTNNTYGYKFDIVFFEAAMQGINVTSDISTRLAQIHARQQDFDAIVIVRGGGSKLDLAAFDHLLLAQTIAKSKLPIITGIGHDIDESLSDLVAHTSLKTPTAVADFLIQRVLYVESYLQEASMRVAELLRTRIDREQQHLQLAQTRLQQSQRLWLQQAKQQLDFYSKTVQLLHPNTILKKGYVMVQNEDGKIIQQATLAKAEKTLTLHFYDGTVTTTPL